MAKLRLAVVVVLLALAAPVMGQYVMEYQAGPMLLPANCSTWHELYPSFCLPHHQDDFTDNGDGVLSACDYIVLDGIRYHVDWVGPTYELEYGSPGYWEPIDTGTNPICQTWHQVHPQFCVTGHVSDWADANGNGIVDACDYVWINGMTSHVVAVRTNIRISVTSPTEPSSWGLIKNLFTTF